MYEFDQHGLTCAGPGYIFWCQSVWVTPLFRNSEPTQPVLAKSTRLDGMSGDDQNSRLSQACQGLVKTLLTQSRLG